MPLKLKVSIDQAAVNGLTSPGGIIDKAAARAAGKTRDRAKQNLTQAGRVDTGALRQSIVSERSTSSNPNQVTYEVGSPLPYALFVERGTGIYGPYQHEILPRRARVLRFKPNKNYSGTKRKKLSPDGFIFTSSVPGMKPERYLSKALDQLSAKDFA